MRKILITSDLHFERIEEGLIPKIKDYIKATIEKHRPNIFCIAGDTVDDANLRAETSEFAQLVSFIDDIAKFCKEKNTLFIVLRGTPSHDGKVMENVSKILNNFIYVDEMQNANIQGISMLLVPELYYSKYELFKADLDKFHKSDVVIFHGMMDFAIPALNQIDSKFNMGRSIVVNSKDFIDKARYCVVGGHVHSDLSFKNIYYTNRIINERGHSAENKGYGLKLITLYEYDYKYEYIENPYLIKHEYINLDFVNSTIDVILANSRRDSYDNVIFNVSLDNSESTKYKYNVWRTTIPAKYIKKTSVKNTEDRSYTMTKTVLKSQDALHILTDIYKERYAKEIPQHIIDEIIGSDIE